MDPVLSMLFVRNFRSICAICVCSCSERVGEQAALLLTNARWKTASDLCSSIALSEKAQALARELTSYFSGPRVLGPEARLAAIRWEDAELRAQLHRTDLVINATTLGVNHSDRSPLPHALIAPHLMIYDLIYRQTPTPLLAAAAAAGARGANGLTMLLHQGALAFELWFDRPAPLAAMRAALTAK